MGWVDVIVKWNVVFIIIELLCFKYRGYKYFKLYFILYYLFYVYYIILYMDYYIVFYIFIIISLRLNIVKSLLIKKNGWFFELIYFLVIWLMKI